jgi:hypothetical protein
MKSLFNHRMAAIKKEQRISVGEDVEEWGACTLLVVM